MPLIDFPAGPWGHCPSFVDEGRFFLRPPDMEVGAEWRDRETCKERGTEHQEGHLLKSAITTATQNKSKFLQQREMQTQVPFNQQPHILIFLPRFSQAIFIHICTFPVENKEEDRGYKI